mmetsp:Transcript_31929/g.63250  ORF Transcript_31929/g.63250 Transcript_31929/m.63250 type:complete len:109 (-) Transcript_31929:275-601(-)
MIRKSRFCSAAAEKNSTAHLLSVCRSDRSDKYYMYADRSAPRRPPSRSTRILKVNKYSFLKGIYTFFSLLTPMQRHILFTVICATYVSYMYFLHLLDYFKYYNAHCSY